MGIMGNGQRPAGSKSVIDRGTTMKGSLVASSTVQVLGVLEGEIIGPAVEVESGGVLLGKAKVGSLRSRGELAGEFEADDVELGGLVRDQTIIRAKSLVVPSRSEAGGQPEVRFGECQIDIGDPPSKEQAVTQALAAARPTPPPQTTAIILPSEPPPLPSAPPPAEPMAEAAPAESSDADGQPGGASHRRKRPAGDRPSEGPSS